ncbi:MAG: NAD-dependent epimerase [Candidatus Rokuibacteriota bacterium]|nr:MAG: NAD-dependent epimerase [Candidatus Rokubacteria bacterium]
MHRFGSSSPAPPSTTGTIRSNRPAVVPRTPSSTAAATPRSARCGRSIRCTRRRPPGAPRRNRVVRKAVGRDASLHWSFAMQVFVTGATGYVGSSVATAFRRAGHRVWGLTRTEAKARRLAQQEIEPVVGELGDPKTYAEVAAECAVLVHAAFEYSANGVAKDKQAIDTLIEAGRRGARPKTLIFTSGAWVHGDTGDRMVDETTPLNPIKLVAWRPAHEQLVLEASGVRGLVIRPGCVYGGPGGLTAPWFADASAGKAPTVVGDGRSRWTMVHGDDLADAYVRAGESGLGGEVFDISDRSRATALEMATAAARAAGYRGEIRPVPLAEAAKTMGDFAAALALSQHVDARKAVRLLGWQPRHGGFVDEADVYYRAWRAHQA